MYPYDVLCDFENSLVEKLGYTSPPSNSPRPFWMTADGNIDYRKLPQKVIEIHFSSYSDDERRMIFEMLNTYSENERTEKLYFLAYYATVSKDDFFSLMKSNFADSNNFDLERDCDLINQLINSEWDEITKLKSRLVIYRAKSIEPK